MPCIIADIKAGFGFRHEESSTGLSAHPGEEMEQLFNRDLLGPNIMAMINEHTQRETTQASGLKR